MDEPTVGELFAVNPDPRVAPGRVPVLAGRNVIRGAHRWSHPPAPREPEWRGRNVSGAPEMTLDEMASSLATDPEFRQWAAEEVMAELGAMTRRVMR